MAIVYVEPRAKARDEHEPIVGYVVESHAGGVLHEAHTQAEAINWATSHAHTVHVARVRHLTDKKVPDHWRKI